MEPGYNLGPYRIVDKIGAGGMGDVYLGEDTRLGRRVAIKVLPAEFAGDAERLARFEQEARAAAALNHANIAAVFDVGQLAGAGATTRYIVQEYLQGQTLRQALEAGPIPLRRAVELGIGVASGLAAAHAAGVVHRDLKPENVFVVGDGTAKILDFGLAKLMPQARARSGDASESPTVLGTMAGSVMGTAGYMAPEQVQGLPADARADLFAFGCLLHEAISLQRAFPGRNVAEILSRIVNEPATPFAIGLVVPLRLQWLLQKCLAKEPERRYQSAAELLVDLRQVAREVESGVGITVPPAAASHAASRPAAPAWGMALGALALGAAGLVAGGWLARAPAPEVLQLDIAPENLEIGSMVAPVVSPDGRRVLYRAGGSLWLRELQQATARQLPDTEAAQMPFWSPDSQEIGYARDGRLFVQRLDGPPVPLTEVPDLSSGAGAHWSEDGRIVYSVGSSALFTVPARGGAATLFRQPDAGAEEAHFHRGIHLPGGAFAYIAHRVGGTADTIAAIRDGQRHELLRLQGDYLADLALIGEGTLLFSRQGVNGTGIWVAELDVNNLTLTGEPVMLVAGAAHASVSADGERLLYDPRSLASRAGRKMLVLVTSLTDAAAGSGVEALTDWEELMDRSGQRLSPDGARVAFVRLNVAGSDLWTIDMTRRTRVRIDDDLAFDRDPEWSDDGRWIYYTRDDAEIWRVAADGSASPERLGAGRGAAVVHGTDRLLVLRGSMETGSGDDLWLLEARPEGGAEIFLAARNSIGRAAVSPDGAFVAYPSNDNGRWDVFVRAIAGEQPWLVSRDGGDTPRWSQDGSALYFVDPRLALHRVSVGRGEDGAPAFGEPQQVLQLTPEFDVRDITPVQTPGGVRFLTQLTESVSNAGRLVLTMHARALIREALQR